VGDVGESGPGEPACDLLIFFEGRCSSAGGVVFAVVGGERWNDDRALLGTCIPSCVSETDFRRVCILNNSDDQTLDLVEIVYR